MLEWLYLPSSRCNRIDWSNGVWPLHRSTDGGQPFGGTQKPSKNHRTRWLPPSTIEKLWWCVLTLYNETDFTQETSHFHPTTWLPSDFPYGACQILKNLTIAPVYSTVTPPKSHRLLILTGYAGRAELPENLKVFRPLQLENKSRIKIL